ncbi:4430_t:CDS:2, partial [Gigaspora rosea]
SLNISLYSNSIPVIQLRQDKELESESSTELTFEERYWKKTKRHEAKKKRQLRHDKELESESSTELTFEERYWRRTKRHEAEKERQLCQDIRIGI